MAEQYPLLTLSIRYEHDVVLSRQRARTLAALLGFDPVDQTRISTAVSEIARNAFAYAGRGEVRFEIVGSKKPQEFRITVEDTGPGIPNLKEILEGRYQSATGMGSGILGSKRLMDTFQIQSIPGKGTTVHMGKLFPNSAPLVTPELMGRITLELGKHRPQDPFQEIQQQNQELIRAMNELQNRQEQLERLNQELADTNRGVVALYAELEEKAASLQSANEIKTRFLSNMSHEFRTPLNTILSLAQLLLDRVDGELSEEQEKQVLFIKKAAENLSELINDLLDLAKIEAGKTTLTLSEFSVKELFSILRGMLKPILVNPAVALIFEDPNPDITVFNDEGKVSQILRNFISNAIKFTERGEIRVRAVKTEDGKAIHLSVKDTGIGIPRELQAKIFEEYYQINTPLHQKNKGTGLGLAISKKLAELLGGKITLESEPGIGSTFTLVLPVTHPQGTENQSRVQESKKIADPLREPVLLIEDEETIALLYEKYLKGSGFQLMHVRSLKEARQLLATQTPCAILLDILLASEDGWAFLTELKADPRTQSIPVLVVSVLKEHDKGMFLGAEDFCTKPLDRKWLLQKLRTIEQRSPLQKILVIDDEEASRYILKSILSDTKYQILEASGGEEGIRLAMKEKPQLIFLDLVMPGMDGIQTLKHLKDVPETRDIPVLILTSKVLEEKEKAQLKESVMDVLSKRSVSRESVLQSLRDALFGLRIQLHEKK